MKYRLGTTLGPITAVVLMALVALFVGMLAPPNAAASPDTPAIISPVAQDISLVPDSPAPAAINGSPQEGLVNIANGTPATMNDNLDTPLNRVVYYNGSPQETVAKEINTEPNDHATIAPNGAMLKQATAGGNDVVFPNPPVASADNTMSSSTLTATGTANITTTTTFVQVTNDHLRGATGVLNLPMNVFAGTANHSTA